MPSSLRSFSEREVYLAEFRGRTVGIAWPAEVEPEREPLRAVMEALVAGGARVVLLAANEALFDEADCDRVTDASDAGFAPALWRRLREQGRAGLALPEVDFEAACLNVSMVLRLAKLVWIQPTPPIERQAGDGRVSVVDLAHLEALLASDPTPEFRVGDHRVRTGCLPLVRAIRDLIARGTPSVNVCAPKDLARELFTYAGAGTFFTTNRYAEVRPLSLDDYDLANDLIERGEADGYLAPRDQAARDDVLAHGLGVFIEGRYLAGIGAILPHAAAGAAELASLFALTRYVGEGAGGQIVRYAVERCREEGFEYLFSCTTSDHVERFFERHGFVRVGDDGVPAEKWEGYDASRRARVRCLRFELRS
jgi:amino-acid N-acetyltransferase